MKPSAETAHRHRKAHKKSRLGCRNCKLRRVKCDESRPKCEKCTSFGVACNYDSNIPDLQLRTGAAACIGALDMSYLSISEMTCDMINLSLNRGWAAAPENNEVVPFACQDLERLVRFQERTVLTIGTPRSAQVYLNQVTKLACMHPYLMHLVQTITAVHDRYLSARVNINQTMTETYHWAKAAAMVNQKLSTPIEPCDRDTLWAAAVLLGLVAFSSIEVSKPEEAWPLKSASSSDLEWLRMSCGKKAVWDLVDPLRKGGVFHEVADHYMQEYLLPIESEPPPRSILAAFVRLCNLYDSPDLETNPYYAAVHSLAPLLSVDCNHSTILRFLSYISYMDTKFQDLLQKKDPRALLLLTYWYAKIRESQWWITRRATLEGRATCIYLERYHGDHTAIQALLVFPKTKLWLAV